MTAWPGSLPQTPSTFSYVQTVREPVIRFSMDQGPDKLRRRVTRIIREIQMQFVMTTAQVNTLRTFYNTTIQGTGDVDWTDDLTGGTAVYRFIGPPAYNWIDAGNWSVSIRWEVKSDTTYPSTTRAVIAASLSSVTSTAGVYTASLSAYANATLYTGSITASASASVAGGQSVLLRENGSDRILLENGDRILLE